MDPRIPYVISPAPLLSQLPPFADHSTAFASPQMPGDCNSTTMVPTENSSETGVYGRESTVPLFAWGQSAYSATNLTAYNNLTTSITPLVTVMFVNHSTNSNTTEGYSQSQLLCPRASNIQVGSVKPTAVPLSDAAKKLLNLQWTLAVVWIPILVL